MLYMNELPSMVIVQSRGSKGSWETAIEYIVRTVMPRSSFAERNAAKSCVPSTERASRCSFSMSMS